MAKKAITPRPRPLSKASIQTHSEFNSEKSEINIRINLAPLKSLIKPAQKILSNIVKKPR